MKSRLSKKLIAYGFFPFMVVFFALSPFGIDTAHASGYGLSNLWGDLFPDLSQKIANFLATLLVGLNMVLTALLFYVGRLLDFAIQFSIAPNVDPDTGLGSLYQSQTISTAWNLLRDIINMFFIFVLLYVAIGTILNIQNVNWKKQLAQIIVAAILVNFSLFITRVVIDAGNIVANSLYQEMTVCEPGECGGRENVGISERFVDALGIPYFTQIKDGNIFTQNKKSEWAPVAVAIVQIIVTLIAIWVFFSVAILFFTRTVALMFILILSPVGIAGSSIPLLGKFAERWRGELFKQALLGVVFLFFTFVIMLFASHERDLILANSDNLLDDVSRNLMPVQSPKDSDFRPEAYFVMYALIAVALIMTLRITKSLSGQGASWMEGVRKKIIGTTLGVAGLGLGVAAGGAALAGRQTLGRAAQATLDSQRGKDLKTKAESGDRGALASYAALRNTAGGSFDVRTTKLGGVATKQASKLGGIAGLNASTGAGAGKGGRTAKIKKTAEEDAKKIEYLSPQGLREYAQQSEDRAAKYRWSPKAGIHKKRAEELRKMANRKETSKEERDKTLEKATQELSDNLNDPAKAKDRMRKIRATDYRSLPPAVLQHQNFIANLGVSELKALSNIEPEFKETIYNQLTASSSASANVKAYLTNPENGWEK